MAGQKCFSKPHKNQHEYKDYVAKNFAHDVL